MRYYNPRICTSFTKIVNNLLKFLCIYYRCQQTKAHRPNPDHCLFLYGLSTKNSFYIFKHFYLFILYIERGIYFEELAHTIMETWQVQNLDEVGWGFRDRQRAAALGRGNGARNTKGGRDFH